MSKKSSEKKIEELTYEEAYSELSEIVTNLESKQHLLEESLAIFERGQSLAKHCSALLERAVLKVRQLSTESLENEGNEKS